MLYLYICIYYDVSICYYIHYLWYMHILHVYVFIKAAVLYNQSVTFSVKNVHIAHAQARDKLPIWLIFISVDQYRACIGLFTNYKSNRNAFLSSLYIWSFIFPNFICTISEGLPFLEIPYILTWVLNSMEHLWTIT